jgi:uncharacterized protein involved in exopolysaccharide biosynthesis
MARDDRDFHAHDADLIDTGLLRAYLGYGATAIRRHVWQAALVWLVIVSATVGVLMVLPKTYHAEARIAAQRNAVLSVRGDTFVDPVHGAPQIVLDYANLVLIARQTDLVKNWEANRAPASRLKDAIVRTFGTARTDDDKLKALVWLLETNMSVSPGDGTISIGIDWSNATMAARLVDAALENFLESRHVSEISTITESISILESHAAKLREEIESVVEETRKARAKKAGKPDTANKATATAGTTAQPAPRRVARREPDEQAMQIKTLIDAKQRSINDLEEFRQRRVLELQTKLSEQKARYTSAHPIVVDLEQNLATLAQESPRVTGLREELAQLKAQYQERTNEKADEDEASARSFGGAARAPAGPLAAEITQFMDETKEERDPAVEAQLRYAVEKYSSLRNHISSSRVDLDLAQAAFKYRYRVISPAEVPKAPIKPKALRIIAASVLGGLLIALFLAIASEIRRDRVVQSWQVERALDLPVLAEVPVPRLPPGKS